MDTAFFPAAVKPLAMEICGPMLIIFVRPFSAQRYIHEHHDRKADHHTNGSDIALAVMAEL